MRRGSRPLAAEKTATLNFKSEPRGGPEQHPGRERRPGSLPFPLHTADPCCRIMGGITSSPAVPLLRGSSDKHENTTISPALLPAAQEVTGPLQLRQIQVFLPAATALPLQRPGLAAVFIDISCRSWLPLIFQTADFHHRVNNRVNSSLMQSLPDFGGSLLCT